MHAELSILVSSFFALVVVLGLVWGGARLARLSGFAPRVTGGRALALRDALPLDARRRLLLVRCAGRDLLLLTGGAQDMVVGWLPPGPDPATDAGTESKA